MPEVRTPRPKAIVIGTGFGGAVTAHRLVNAGFDVVVLERGRRFEGNDFPSLPEAEEVFPDFARWAWSSSVLAIDEKRTAQRTGKTRDQLRAQRRSGNAATVSSGSPPWADDPRDSDDAKQPATPSYSRSSHWSIAQGLWDVRDMGGIVTVHAAGYGGGSLVYANVHLRAPEAVFAEGWPSGIERKTLDAYYDRVAAMLDINPITESPKGTQLPKTVQFDTAAQNLNRKTFYPPLAIHFDETAKNHSGREQNPCTFCGECDSGCRVKAKNTLDLNYLVNVDEKADVRTLAEVLWIQQIESDHGGATHCVTYFDHANGIKRTESAKYVFLCAGSVCSTEILMRSAKLGFLKNLSGKLGTHFYANADSLSIAFDTDQPHEPGNGPTITTALVHDDRKGPSGTWFMLQDGGYPAAATRAIGAVRARALLGRNAYPAKARTFGDPFALKAPEKREAPFRAFPDGLYWVLKNGDLRSRPDRDVVPRALSTALSQLLVGAHELGRRELGAIVPAVTSELRERRIDRFVESVHLTWWKGLRKVLLSALKCLYRLAGADDPTVVAVAQGILVDRFAPTIDNATRVAAWLLDWEQPPSRPTHRAVLLGMGRDDVPGRFRLDRDGEFRIRLGLDPRGQTYGDEELLMRDMAAQWKAELRVNPAWAAARRPVSVHNQGGCPMADDAAHGVVDGWGAVFGHPGLFVFDGAALPRAVGVNPSSTIAALTERNVEHFLRTCGEPGLPASFDDPGEAERIAKWRDKAKEKGWALEPPSSAPGTSPPAFKSKPIGIRFQEVMSGFHAPVAPLASATNASGAEPLRGLLDELGLGDDLEPLVRKAPEAASSGNAASRAQARPRTRDLSPEPTEYEAAYLRGCDAHDTVSLTMNASIPDVVMFDADDRHRLHIKGTIEFVWGRENIDTSGKKEVALEGHADLFVPLTFGDYVGPDRIMLYDLGFDVPGRGAWRVLGYKRMHANEGTRAWADTTNLFVRISNEHEDLVTFGVARLPLETLLYDVLGKMDVTGTSDPARTAWAIATFGAVFFGHLGDLYLPKLGRYQQIFTLDPMAKRK
jgi:choline dehydrogenase-like flavoprotein